MSFLDWAVFALGAIAGIGLLLVMAPLVVLHLRARAAGVRIAMVELIGMRLRRVSAGSVVAARIQAARAGLEISTRSIETHALCGGDVLRVVEALTQAKRRGMALTWMEASAYDLAGRDVLAAVRTGVTPRVGVKDAIPPRAR